MRYSYYYQPDGSITDVLNFFALVELWQQEPIVRKLYRDTPNEDTVPRNTWKLPVYLYYEAGTATAEDELIQKIRLHFVQGSKAALNARAPQNGLLPYGTVNSASFWDGHTETMRTRVCDAVRNSEPENLQAAFDGGSTVLSWDAPTHDAESVTGYRILRGVEGETPTEHVADTGTADTTWTDENPAPGDYAYAVQTVYDGYYLSRESEQVRQIVVLTTPAPTPTGLAAASTHSSVALTWDDPGDSSITGYQVLRRDTSNQEIGDFSVLVDDTGTSDTACSDTDVVAGRMYMYRVKARKGSTLSAESDYVNVRVPQPPQVTASFASGSHSVTEDGTAEIALELEADPERTVTIPIERTNGGGASDDDLTGVPREVTFDAGEPRKTFTVTATDDAEDDDGESVILSLGTLPYRVLTGIPDTAVITITDNDEPLETAAPTGLRGQATHETVTLTWDDPEDDSITGYQIRRRDTSHQEIGEFSVLVDDTGTLDTAHTDTDVVAGRRYVYRIKARYGSTLSVTSDYVNVRVSRPPDVEVSFEESVYAINEGASATIRIILSADPKRTVVVEITRTNQGDAADEDLTGVPENVTFIPGDIEASFTLNADDDSEFRGNISVTLAFGTLPDRVSAGSNSQATVSITDNDPGVSAKAINPPATHDGSASFRVKVRFSKPLRNSRTKVIKAFRDTTGAKVGGARRANTSATPLGQQDWEITLKPTGGGDIVMKLRPGGPAPPPGRSAPTTTSGSPPGAT